MYIRSVSAYFDGEQILLDEELELKLGVKLIVTVLPNSGNERDEWINLSRERLADGYALDEMEYPIDLLKEINPEHEEE
jgi:hypothetical protein